MQQYNYCIVAFCDFGSELMMTYIITIQKNELSLMVTHVRFLYDL